MSAATKPPAPYKTWAELLLDRWPVAPHEWARVEDVISYAKQFEIARAELDALRAELQDWRDCAANAAGEKCDDASEKHCSCVGLLRRELNTAKRDAERWMLTSQRQAEEEHKLRARVARLEEALTPSAATKAAYHGEFFVRTSMYDDDNNEHVDDTAVPWTTIKDIMKEIWERAVPPGPHLPPDVLIDALHDPIHPTSGRLLASKPIVQSSKDGRATP